MEMIKFHLFRLFQKVPGSSLSNEIIIGLVAFGIILLLASFLLKIWRKNTKNKTCKKYIREYPRGLFWFGLVSLVLVWFRLESVPVFSMRLWWLVYWISFAIWAYSKIKKTIKLKKRLTRSMSNNESGKV